jgi:hypothetical protein
VIVNDGSLEELETQVAALMQRLTAPSEATR